MPEDCPAAAARAGNLYRCERAAEPAHTIHGNHTAGMIWAGTAADYPHPPDVGGDVRWLLAYARGLLDRVVTRIYPDHTGDVPEPGPQPGVRSLDPCTACGGRELYIDVDGTVLCAYCRNIDTE